MNELYFMCLYYVLGPVAKCDAKKSIDELYGTFAGEYALYSAYKTIQKGLKTGNISYNTIVCVKYMSMYYNKQKEGLTK